MAATAVAARLPPFAELSCSLLSAGLPAELSAALDAATPFLFHEAVEMAAKSAREVLAPVLRGSVDAVSSLLHGHASGKRLFLSLFWLSIVQDQLLLRFARKMQTQQRRKDVPLLSLLREGNGILSPAQLWALEKGAEDDDSKQGEGVALAALSSLQQQPFSGWRTLFEGMAGDWAHLASCLVLGIEEDTGADADADGDESKGPSSLALSKVFKEAASSRKGGGEGRLAALRFLAVEVVATLFHCLWAAPNRAVLSSRKPPHARGTNPAAAALHSSPFLEPWSLRCRTARLVDHLLFGHSHDSSGTCSQAKSAFPALLPPSELQSPPLLPPSLLKPSLPFSYATPPVHWRSWMVLLENRAEAVGISAKNSSRGSLAPASSRVSIRTPSAGGKEAKEGRRSSLASTKAFPRAFSSSSLFRQENKEDAGPGRLLADLLGRKEDKDAVVAVEKVAKAASEWTDSVAAALDRNEALTGGAEADAEAKEKKAREKRRQKAIETVKAIAKLAASGAAFGSSRAGTSGHPASSSPARQQQHRHPHHRPTPRLSPLLALHLHHHRRRDAPIFTGGFGNASLATEAREEILSEWHDEVALVREGQGSADLTGFLVSCISRLVIEEDAEVTRKATSERRSLLETPIAKPKRAERQRSKQRSKPTPDPEEEQQVPVELRPSASTLPLPAPHAPLMTFPGLPEEGAATTHTAAAPLPSNSDVWRTDDGVNVITRGLELNMRIELMERGIDLPDNVFLTAVPIAGDDPAAEVESPGDESGVSGADSTRNKTAEDTAASRSYRPSAGFQSALNALAVFPLSLFREVVPLDPVEGSIATLKAAAHAMAVAAPTSSVTKETLPRSWLESIARRCVTAGLPSGAKPQAEAEDPREDLAVKTKKSIERSNKLKISWDNKLQSGKREMARARSETALQLASMHHRVSSLLALPSSSVWEAEQKRTIVEEEGKRIARSRNEDFFLVLAASGAVDVDGDDTGQRVETEMQAGGHLEALMNGGQHSEQQEDGEDDANEAEVATVRAMSARAEKRREQDQELESAAHRALQRELAGLGVTTIGDSDVRGLPPEDLSLQLLPDDNIAIEKWGYEIDRTKPLYLLPAVTGKSGKQSTSVVEAVLVTKKREQKRRQEEQDRRRKEAPPLAPAIEDDPRGGPVFTPAALVREARRREEEEERGLGLAPDDMRRITADALRKLQGERKRLMAISGHAATIDKLSRSRPQSAAMMAPTPGDPQFASSLQPSLPFPSALMDVALISPSLSRLKREQAVPKLVASPSKTEATVPSSEVHEGASGGKRRRHRSGRRRLSFHEAALASDATNAAALSALQQLTEADGDTREDDEKEEKELANWLSSFEQGKGVVRREVAPKATSTVTPSLLPPRKEKLAPLPGSAAATAALRSPVVFGASASIRPAPRSVRPAPGGSASVPSLLPPSVDSLGEVAVLRHSVERRRLREAVLTARKSQLESMRSAFVKQPSASASASAAAAAAADDAPSSSRGVVSSLSSSALLREKRVQRKQASRNKRRRSFGAFADDVGGSDSEEEREREEKELARLAKVKVGPATIGDLEAKLKGTLHQLATARASADNLAQGRVYYVGSGEKKREETLALTTGRSL